MSALQQFLDSKNSFAKIFGDEITAMPKTRRECEPLFRDLECKLSPENLHCDGEISRAEAQRKYDYFMKVHAELEAIAGPRELIY